MQFNPGDKVLIRQECFNDNYKFYHGTSTMKSKPIYKTAGTIYESLSNGKSFCVRWPGAHSMNLRANELSFVYVEDGPITYA